MALNEQEKEIVLVGQQGGKTPEQIMQAVTKYRQEQSKMAVAINTAPTPEEDPNYLQRLGAQFKAGAERLTTGLETSAAQVQKGMQEGGVQGVKDIVEGSLKGGLRTVGAVAGTAFAPVIAAVEPAIKPVIEKLATVPGIKGGIEVVNTWASKHPEAARDLQDVFDIATLGGGKVLETPIKELVKTTGKQVAQQTGRLASATTEGIGQTVRRGTAALQNAASEVIPSSERIVNTQVTKALDLTQGDVKNIARSTGNEVGQFLAEKNLIRSTKKETEAAVDAFYKENYNAVRAEIGKVTDTYKTSQIPRYKEALTELNKQVSDIPGLQAATKEVKALLAKKNPTLNDVQRVKELMDEHFSLYKVTGDVKESLAKEGLANIRGDLRGFIEKEVLQKTGADISDLNRNTATSRSIGNAITERSTRGLTRSNIKMGDLGIFAGGSAIGTPLFGAALVVGKKILESPAIRLRWAKYLDGVSDARKAKIKSSLEKGQVPEEMSTVVTQSSSLSKKSNIPNIARDMKPKNAISKTMARGKNNVNKKSFNQGTVPQTVKKIGTGDFGDIFRGIKGISAIRFLINRKSGEIQSALKHKDVGDIDIVWGNENMGLQKIASKHPDVLENMQDILDESSVVSKTKNRIQLESNDHKSAIRLDWNGKEKKWLLTMFRKTK